MAVPKRRQSKARSRSRRSHAMKISVPQSKPCPRCEAPQISHRACSKCGYYKDRVVVEVPEEETA